jgi:hypothetical protein
MMGESLNAQAKIFHESVSNSLLGSEAEFLDNIQTKLLRVYFQAIHSHPDSFEISISSILPYGLRNPYKNLKSENSQDFAQISQQNCTIMNSASGFISE